MNAATRPGVVAVLPAGGKGRRMGGELPKQFLPLEGRPLLWHTLRAFERSRWVDRVVVVLQPEDMAYCRRCVLEQGDCTKVGALVAGGHERFASVRAGLQALKKEDELVLVHDAVRPFVDEALIGRIVEAVQRSGAAIPGLPLKETVKQADGGRVDRTLDRSQLYGAQTPQGFWRELLLRAYEDLPASGVTDDAMLVERLGHPVEIVPGDERNIKVTTPLDLAWARWLLDNKPHQEER